MSTDPAVRAAKDALSEALQEQYIVTHEEMVRVAVEAARPIIEAEAIDKAVDYMAKYGIRNGQVEPRWRDKIRDAARAAVRTEPEQ